MKEEKVQELLNDYNFMTSRNRLFCNKDYLNIHQYLGIILISLLMLGTFYWLSLFDFDSELLKIISYAFGLVLTFFGFVSLCAFFHMVFAKELIIYKNKLSYLEKMLSSSEREKLQKLIPEMYDVEIRKLNKLISKKCNEIEREFQDKDALKSFYSIMEKDKGFFDCYSGFFTILLKQYNKNNGFRNKKIDEMNEELEKAGFNSINAKQEDLELSIIENDN